MQPQFQFTELVKKATAAVRKLHSGYFIHNRVTNLLKELKEQHRKIQFKNDS